MTFTVDGLIYKFTNLLGVELQTSTAQYITFVVGAVILAVCLISFMLLLFRLLVFIRKG